MFWIIIICLQIFSQNTINPFCLCRPSVLCWLFGQLPFFDAKACQNCEKVCDSPSLQLLPPPPPPSQTKLQRYNTPPPIDGCYRWSRGGFINLRRQNAPAGASCVPSLENKSHPIFFDAAHSCLFKDGNRRVGPVVVNSALC